MSIEEIWSFKVKEDEVAKEDGNQADDTLAEELVEFDADGSDAGSTSEAVFVPDETSHVVEQQASNVVSEPLHFDSTETSPADSAVSEFEMLDDGDQQDGSGDPILDELEAEIARELED